MFFIFSQPAVCFEKSPSQKKIDEEHLFWGTARGVLFLWGSWCLISIEEPLRHIFEKVLICIERGMYSVHFKEMNLFKNNIFWKGCSFFTSQLSCSHPLASLENKRNTLYNNRNCTLYITIVYGEILSCSWCINIIFQLNKVVFRVCRSYLIFFNWGVPHIFPARWNWWGTPFLRNSSWDALLMRKLMSNLYRCWRIICCVVYFLFPA